LLNSEYGIDILYNNIIKLDADFSELKLKEKKFLRGKSYKNLILFMNNADIIAIVLSNAIPFCKKFEKVENQNTATLVEKIGKDILNIFYRSN